MDGKKAANFAVCNMFVDENGTVAVEKTIQLVFEAFLENRNFGNHALRSLIKELGNFLNVVGVCEVELSDSATCSKRSVLCLTSLYATLAKLARDLAANIPENNEIYQSILESAFDAMDLANNVPCIHPVTIWENLLPSLPLYEQSTIGNDFPRQKLKRHIFGLIESNVAHFNNVSHPTSVKWKFTNVNGSLSDSDSAFYASDASENRNSGDSSSLHVQYLQYLTPYTRFLSYNFDDFSESTLFSVKEMLNHLSQVLSVAPMSTKLEILSAVLLPSLEFKLKTITSRDNDPPNEIDLLLIQRILFNIRHLIKNKDALNACNQERIFPIVLSARHIEWLRDDVFRFIFYFVDQEMRLIMSNATSLESLTVWSGIEVPEDESDAAESCPSQSASKIVVGDEEVCHAKAVYRTFSTNGTLSDVLLLLESRSEEFITTSTLSPSCLSETFALWNLQVKLTFNQIYNFVPELL